MYRDMSTYSSSASTQRHGGSSSGDGEEPESKPEQTELLMKFQYDDLPNATSIRLLDIVESSPDAGS